MGEENPAHRQNAPVENQHFLTGPRGLPASAASKMGVFIIEPIFTATEGGLPATIIGVDALSDDLLVGEYTAQDGERRGARWNLNGSALGSTSDADLDLRHETLTGLVALVSKFLAKRFAKVS
jgi:hypothetical protein